MKKSVILILAFVLCGSIAFAQNNKKAYILTDKGVDVIKIGQQFVTNPQSGSFYNKCKLSGDYYTLYNNNTEVGRVIINRGNVAAIEHLTSKDIKLDNGISIGTPIRSLFNMDGVKVVFEYYMDLGTYDVGLYYNNVYIGIDAENDLTPETIRFINQRLQEGNPIYYLKAEEFKEGSTVKFFVVPSPVQAYD